MASAGPAGTKACHPVREAPGQPHRPARGGRGRQAPFEGCSRDRRGIGRTGRSSRSVRRAAAPLADPPLLVHHGRRRRAAVAAAALCLRPLGGGSGRLRLRPRTPHKAVAVVASSVVSSVELRGRRATSSDQAPRPNWVVVPPHRDREPARAGRQLRASGGPGAARWDVIRQDVPGTRPRRASGPLNIKEWFVLNRGTPEIRVG